MAERLEPWLRGTHADLDPLRRAVLHALELAREDINRWCAPLDVTEMESKPFGLPSAGFQLRHIARSLDRLMSYAEGRALSDAQLLALREEHRADEHALASAEDALQQAIDRLLAISPDTFSDPRNVGRAMLPSTVGGLIIHVAEHTQRHVGQAITTAKVTMALRGAEGS